VVQVEGNHYHLTLST